MRGAKATVHGAVSLVNALATGRGATLGISLKVEATVRAWRGRGIEILSRDKNLSSRLVNATIAAAVPKRDLERNRVSVALCSEIPTGYGLKSSSAISSAISLACARLFRPKYTDQQVLLAGVDASIRSKVSVTGAYDDACSCYYGGFNVTDNAKRRRVRFERAPQGLEAVIFIPRGRKRGNIKRLQTMSLAFRAAWDMADRRDYWAAMAVNGLAASAVLGSDPDIMSSMLDRGALGASVSGNGPAIAAVARRENVPQVRKALAALDGRIITSKVNNKKASVHDL